MQENGVARLLEVVRCDFLLPRNYVEAANNVDPKY